MGVQEHSTIYFLVCLPLLVHSLKQEAVKALDAFQKDCLDAHNTYRAQHGVPPLVWSEELAQHAQNWADQLASRDEVKHDLVAMNKHDEGENLAFFHPAVPKCQGSMEGNCVLCREMIKRWYDEVKNYDYDNGHSKNPDGITKHFTQIIWANTSEVGIGTSVSKKYGFITVARYRPGGNRGGTNAFVVNVPPEGGPLPSLSNYSPKVKPKSTPSTTPTGNGIPVTSPDSSKPPQGTQGSSVIKTLTDTNAVSNKKEVPNTLTGSLDGSAIEKIQTNPMGYGMNDEVENKAPKKSAANLLSMIVDLANKTKPANNDNILNKGATEGNQNQDGPQTLNSAGKPGQNGQEGSSLETIKKDFSYENADSMYSVSNHDSVEGNGGKHGIDSSKTIGIAGSLGNGDHGNVAGITKAQQPHDNYQGQETNSPVPKNGQVDDNKEKSSSEGRTEGNKSNMNDNTPINKEQNDRLNIHTDTGLMAGDNDIQKDLKSKGLVRTVKGPDGTNAQVFLTKNGAHAGLVFRDHISRVSQELKQREFVKNRVINVL
ncbi:cell wall protein PRY3-like [Actinia tenebrosa]|uniref:Cell wall protein PRY3-like n=1 Tax=Actinia tenebrosa TaxID=6105 RepID=A0A6P8IRC3_ACTTE|nr:cell wall protein PRY3-like [Actinia tenebrosa]